MCNHQPHQDLGWRWRVARARNGSTGPLLRTLTHHEHLIFAPSLPADSPAPHLCILAISRRPRCGRATSGQSPGRCRNSPRWPSSTMSRGRRGAGRCGGKWGIATRISRESPCVGRSGARCHAGRRTRGRDGHLGGWRGRAKVWRRDRRWVGLGWPDGSRRSTPDPSTCNRFWMVRWSSVGARSRRRLRRGALH